MSIKDKLIHKYSDKMLEINNADDMDYGDKTGAFMAIAQQLIAETAKEVQEQDLDLEDLM